MSMEKKGSFKDYIFYLIKIQIEKVNIIYLNKNFKKLFIKTILNRRTYNY